jgi:hypothetical protein
VFVIVVNHVGFILMDYKRPLIKLVDIISPSTGHSDKIVTGTLATLPTGEVMVQDLNCGQMSVYECKKHCKSVLVAVAPDYLH